MTNQSCGYHVCVVGGGLAGIAAAFYACRQGKKVTLIESAPGLGGLLRSHHREGMGWFDFGTHLLGKTGIEEVDSAFFEELTSDESWINHDHCPAGVYFRDRLSLSGFVDVRALDQEVYERGFREFLGLEEGYEFENLRDATEGTFGSVFADEVFDPIARKFFGESLGALNPDALRLLGVSRIVGATAEESAELKEGNRWHDHRLAFHNPRTSARQGGVFYPRAGGIGKWVESMERRLVEDGVEIRLSSEVQRVEFEVESSRGHLNTRSDDQITFDELVWTVPPVFLLKAAGVTIPASTIPKFTKTILIDMVLSEAVRSDVFYVNCMEPTMDSFRVTLYDAMQCTDGENPSRVTVEIIVPPGKDESGISPESILMEMKEMGITSSGASIVAAETAEIPFGFPIPSNEFASDQEKIRSAAFELSPSITLLGRAGGNAFFMRDVLSEVHRHFSN